MTEKTTMKSINYAFVTLSVLALVLVAAPAVAEKPETPPPGMARYVMVLWIEGTELPDGGRAKKFEEPDIEKLGGKVLKKTDNRRDIWLPKAAAKQLRKHQAVSYLQRIWMGESLDDWDEKYEPNSRFQVEADSDFNVDWVRTFDYDGTGNIKRSGDDHFVYDSAGRILRAEVGDKVQTFSYDDFGNMTQTAVAGANPADIPVDPSSNRMIGPEYDAAGNVTTRQGRPAYEYDAVNQLFRVRVRPGYTRRMIYDADDERLGMMVDGDSLSRWTIRDFEGRVIREYRGEFAGMGPWYWQLDEIYADGKLVAGERQQFGYFENGAVYGGFRHYHLDQIGSVRVVTNATGDSISEHEYYPFGVTRTKTYQEQMNWGDPHIDSMRFAGHWRDFLGMLNVENTDYLDYMHARYYDPNLGRFLSVDPSWGSAQLQVPQSWNRYAYVMNNPLRYIDPTGREPECIVIKLEDGTMQQICSEKITVEADDPGGASESQKPKLPSLWERTKFQFLNEYENLQYMTADDVPIFREKRDEPCKSYGERFMESFAVTNGVPGLAAPTGMGLMTAGKTAAATDGITALQWARLGFGRATLAGVSWTAAETGIIAGFTALTNTALVAVAWEGGVAIGSAVNAALTDGCN